MNVPFVDLKKQYLDIQEEIDTAIRIVIEKSSFIGGPFKKSFEENFANYCDANFCVGVGSGTDAIYIALRALGIGDGDEVLTAANSFIATSEAIKMSGAKVVFIDIDPATYNIDTNSIESKITDKTRAIIPVHLFGQPADMDPILDIAERYNLKVIEDAAQAHGAIYKDRKIGSIGDVACFSFYPGKNLGAYGDGGALVTDDEEVADKARMISNHGRMEKYNHKFEGINSRLDGLQAAILDVKLKHLPRWIDLRRKNAYLYNSLLNKNDVITPFELPQVKSVYHLYVVRILNGKREKLQEYLKTQGISTGIHYPIALPKLMAYKYLKSLDTDFINSTKASKEILSLPMFPELEEPQIDFIATKINSFIS